MEEFNLDRQNLSNIVALHLFVFLLALSFALASHTESEEQENVRHSLRLRTLVERTHATEQSTPKRRGDDEIAERQFQYCGPNEVLGRFGRCERALVTKNVYAFTAPRYRRPILRPHIPQPKVELNIVFVKTAANEVPPLPVVVPPAQQKTVVYLLSKRPHFNQQVIEVPSAGPTEPEVFFVDYGSGENPRLPGGIDLRTALSQAPLEGQIVSSPPVPQAQQSAFRNQLEQNSFEDNDFQNNFLGQSSISQGVLSQSQRPSSRFVPQSTDQQQSSGEVNHALTNFNQFLSLPSVKVTLPSSNKFQSPSSSQHLSPLSNQFQSQSANQFQRLPSNLYQSPLSNQNQSPARDSFESVDFQQQIPYANHLFESPSNNQFDSESVQSSSSRLTSDKNFKNTHDSLELRSSRSNEFESNKQINLAKNTHIDNSNEFSQNSPANQYQTPSRASSISSSSSSSSFRPVPSRQYQSSSNNLIQDSPSSVQLLQPSQFGQVNDNSDERASVKKKISSLPSGFVPALQNQSIPTKTFPSTARFQPSQSLPNGKFESLGGDAFTPIPGRQYILPPNNFQNLSPHDQRTAAANQYKSSLVVQKLEPEQWEDVPTSDSSKN
ncbi:protein of unknown function DUF243 [Trinorchestia longiramus]|nr:protein of unknown function DUF243 [Trinorchestia longiramus]